MAHHPWIGLFSCFCAIATLFVTGCEGHFVPNQPRAPVVVDGIRARVIDLAPMWRGRRAPRDAVVTIVIDEAPIDARLAEASLAPASRQPCEHARRASWIAVDDRLQADSIRAGSRVTLPFAGEWRTVTDEPTRVDLFVESGRETHCISLDLTSNEPDKTWVFKRPVDVGIALTMSSYTRPVLGSQGSVNALLPLVGFWRGPARFMGGTGMFVDICTGEFCHRCESESECKKCPDGQCRHDSPGLSLVLRADVFPVQKGTFALGIGAHYSLVAMGRRLEENASLAAYHGIAMAPQLAFTFAPGGTGIQGGPRLGTLAIEFPIGIVSAVNDYTHPALSLGVTTSIIF